MTEENIEILLVEDNPSDEMLALHAFKKHNLANKVHVVRDGAEALEFVFCTGAYSERRLLNPKVILLDKKLPAATGAKKPIESQGRPLHILVVEDNALNQLLAKRTLEKAGYSVAVANNGEEGLAAVNRERFDLVLMDVQMPVMDGFQATARIREQEIVSGKHQSIVAMTAHALKGDRVRCLEAGMDGYVSKPIRNSELFAAIAAVVIDSEQSPPESQAALAPGLDGVPTRDSGAEALRHMGAVSSDDRTCA